MELRSGEKFKIEMRKAFFFSICLEDPVRHGRAKPSCRQIESSTRSILFPRENERKSPLELSGTCLNNPSYHCLHINGPALPAPRPSSERKKGPSSSISNLLSYWHSWTQFSHSFSRFFFNNWALFINSHYYLKTWEEEGLLNVDQRVSNVANVLADKVNKYMVTLLLLLYPNPSC